MNRPLHTLPRYTPPPIAGYVFYSNFGPVDINRAHRPVLDHEVIAQMVAARFDISAADVKVIDFNPDDSDSIYANRFAAFVSDKHADLVSESVEQTRTLLSLLDKWSDEL